MAEITDLFLDSIINAPIKDERVTMEFPFFSLQKTPRTEVFEYNDGQTSIRVEPGPRGMATIWDKDVLMYCASYINERIEKGLPVERKVVVPAYDILKVCQRSRSARGYELLLDALTRLRSTTILTNLASGDQTERRGFGWIDNFRVRERKTSDGGKIMEALEITLNEWMFRAIVEDRRVLTINREYFQLTGGLERRLYELARKHCGRQPKWPITLERLAEKCGTTRELRKFKADLKKIAAADNLPDYGITFAFDPAHAKHITDVFGTKAAQRHKSNEKMLVVFMPKGRIGDVDPVK